MFNEFVITKFSTKNNVETVSEYEDEGVQKDLLNIVNSLDEIASKCYDYGFVGLYELLGELNKKVENG
jgi:hypothetical protein